MADGGDAHVEQLPGAIAGVAPDGGAGGALGVGVVGAAAGDVGAAAVERLVLLEIRGHPDVAHPMASLVYFGTTRLPSPQPTRCSRHNRS